MKKLYTLIIVTVVILSVVYAVGNGNFYFGSNSEFYDTAFDCKNSKWRCDKMGIEAFIPAEELSNYMILTDLKTNKKYILFALDNFTVELYLYESFGTSESEYIELSTSQKALYTTQIYFRKKWGKVKEFVIENTDENCWYKSGKSQITFKKVER